MSQMINNLTIYTLMLIALKVDGAGLIASWPWWLIFAPLLAVALVLLCVGLMCGAVAKRRAR